MNFKINTHPNLIPIYDIFDQDNKLYIVMELCEKDQTLSKYIKRVYEGGDKITEKEAVNILYNLL